MSTNPTTQPGSIAASNLDSDRFAVNRIESVQIGSKSSSITFEIEVRHHQVGQRIFCGLLDRELKSGVGLAVDTMTGELVDLINDQGIIGYLNTNPIAEGAPFSVRLTMDKFGPTHICSVHICGEKILYPAVLLDDVSEIGAVVGSTQGKDQKVEFLNPQLEVLPSSTVAA